MEVRLWRILVFSAVMLGGLYEIAWAGPPLEFPKTFPTISISRPVFPGIIPEEGLERTVPQFNVILHPAPPMAIRPVEVSKDFPNFEVIPPQMPTFEGFPSWEKPSGLKIPKWDPPGSVSLPLQGGNCPGGCDTGEGEWGLQYYGPAG